MVVFPKPLRNLEIELPIHKGFKVKFGVFVGDLEGMKKPIIKLKKR